MKNLLTRAIYLFLVFSLAACARDESLLSREGSGSHLASLGRFAARGEYLYTVDIRNLQVLNVSNPEQPQLVFSTQVAFDVETLFLQDDNLFLGAATGVYIYSIARPDRPELTGQYQHQRGCDPVVSDGRYAYLTLRMGQGCGNQAFNSSVLQVLSLEQANPQLVMELPLEEPHGLFLHGSFLYVCDGSAGLKIYDLTNPAFPVYLSTLSGEARDVLVHQGRLMVMSQTDLRQYDLSNPAEPQFLSTLRLL